MDYPYIQDMYNPTLFFHGRVTNPFGYSSIKTLDDESNSTTYLTDDGLGDHFNLWTSSVVYRNNSDQSDYLLNQQCFTYAHQPGYKIGFLVVFELKDPRRNNTKVCYDFGSVVPEEFDYSKAILARTGECLESDSESDEYPPQTPLTPVMDMHSEGKLNEDAYDLCYVFTATAQKIEHSALDIIRVYILDWSTLVEGGRARILSQFVRD
eukprot:UN06932